MKKIISLALVVVLALAAFAFVACDNKEETPSGNNTENNTENNNVEKTYNLAIGVVVNTNDSKATATETVAAIVTDADGKIVLCRVDCIEYAALSKAGEFSTAAPTSKVAQGDDYGKMPAGSWATQVKALETYVVGKTQTEVATVAAEGYAADADLKASCSFYIADLTKAIDNAFKSEHKVTFTSTATSFTAGLSAIGSVKDTSEESVNNAEFTADFAAAILADGKVVAAILDTAEVVINKVTEKDTETDGGAESIAFKDNDNGATGTKREQGDKYAMTSGAWYVQADAYAKSAVGKTASDIATLATEGVAGCTMPYSTFAFKASLEAAVKAAK